MRLRRSASALPATTNVASSASERYRVAAPLGKGGAAQVYRVTDLVHNREIALKRLDPGASPRQVAMFELEYQTLASLQHPRIVEVYEFGRDAQGAYYTMELLQGGDLSDRVPVSWREACRYVRAAAQALGLLHSRRLVHRDVSPRNLWRKPDGSLKLIDFGALAQFGVHNHLVGTPPYVPPEAFHNAAIDQRSDLYSLGAVAYYLLTGQQAFPVRQLQQLPDAWQQRPAPPSQLVSELMRSDLESVPVELDDLIADLLSMSIVGRPSSASELIDRIDALPGLSRPSECESAGVHLANGAFVGRTGERRRLRRQYLLSARGRGQSCLLEGAPGQGRSRLLREFALEVLVTDAVVLQVDASKVWGVYGVANALAHKLLDAMPEQALALAAAHRDVLARLSPRLAERLDVRHSSVDDGGGAGESRIRIQLALRDWFLAVAAQHTLLLLVDGLELLDDGSAAFLLALALTLCERRCMLVCTLRTNSSRAPSATERALRKASHVITLRPLSEHDTLELLRAIFGQTDHLLRLATRVHQVAQGNPSHVLELCAQMIRDALIGFAEGVWILPQAIPNDYLYGSRDDAMAARLALVTGEARELAQLLSLHDAVLPIGLCKVLADTISAGLFEKVESLFEAGILLRTEQGCRFAEEQHRLTLRAELEPERARGAKRVLGSALLAMPGANRVDRLKAGLYLLESGSAEGADIVAQASLGLGLHEIDLLTTALPTIEAALALFRAQQRPSEELVSLVAPLALAGLYADRSYLARYGDEALSLLEELFRFRLAEKLGGFFGRKLGLIFALLVAAVRLGGRKKNPRVPSFREGLQLLFHCVTALVAVSMIIFDSARAERYANTLAPMLPLGPKRIGAFIYDYGMALAEVVRDSHEVAYAHWKRIVERLERPGDVAGMPEHLRDRYLGSALIALGILQAQAEDPAALSSAARMEALGLELHRMGAEQVRALYYAHQGNWAACEQHRERAEQQAIQQGAAWRMEMWTPGMLAALHVRLHDALGVKRSLEQIQRLAKGTPTLERMVTRFEGAYLLLRRRYAEAVRKLESVLREPTPVMVGWANTCGMLARAYNQLGAHEQARALCLDVLARLTPADLQCTAHNTIVQTELLLAEAGLGRAEQAEQQLRQLLLDHAGKGPLTIGELYETGFEIALLRADAAEAQALLAQVEQQYRPLRIPHLEQRCAWLRSKIEKLTAPPRAGSGMQESKVGSSSELTVEQILGGGTMSPAARADRALQLLTLRSHSDQGLLYLFDADAVLKLSSSQGGASPDPYLRAQVDALIARELEDERTEMLEADEESDVMEPLELFEHGSRHYRIHALLAVGARPAGVVGVVLLSRASAAPAACSAELLHSVAFQLHRAHTTTVTTRS